MTADLVCLSNFLKPSERKKILIKLLPNEVSYTCPCISTSLTLRKTPPLSEKSKFPNENKFL